MRPLRVELQGFSTFKEPTTIDFGDTELLAFVGPTGSGKSSVIDAIAFALYGSVSRYDDARLVAPVISQGANEAKVRLDFELADRTYTAVRVVRRTKTGASTREARLELTDAADGESPVVASGAKELTDAVEELLGLDFSQFTRTVVLPQGEFAQFLKDDPASRQKLLRRLLDLEAYSRMGVAARREAASAEERAQVYRRQIDDNDDITPSLLAEHERAAASLERFAETLSVELEAIAEVESRLAGLREQVNEIDADSSLLVEIGMPDDVGGDVGRMEVFRAALESARTGLDAARQTQSAARAKMVDAGDPSRLQQQADASRQLEAATTDLESLTAELATARTAADGAAEAGTRAANLLELAEEGRQAALVGSKAADWISRLVVGEPCPVCRQEVSAVPDHDPAAELVAAETATAEATAVAKSAAEAVRAATEAVHRLEARVEARSAARDTLVASLADAPENLPAALAAAHRAAETLVDADEQTTAAERSVRHAEERVRAAEEQEAELRRVFGAQRDRVAKLGPPPAVGASLSADWSALQTWAAERRDALVAERVEIADAGKLAAEEKATISRRLETSAEAVGLIAEPSKLAAELAQAQLTVTGSIERVRARLADIAEWRAEADALGETHVVYATLGRHLSASGFERWLLAEALDDLVERATARLLELSGGQYSLVVDDSAFAVVDHRSADEQRDVRTLSGGETFLASLALALALADSIAELAPVDAPRLGSMFLDEGFGTLDTETLDVVATAIEELSADGRLVGIVTHIEALAERMPVQMVVSKGPSTSTVERRVR